MLEVSNRILLLIKKCFSSDMLQDFYKKNRSWCYTNHGRIRQNNHADRDQRGNDGLSDSLMSKYRGKSHSVHQASLSRPSANGQFEFSLMTYNCLSQDLIHKHNEMYTECPPGSLNWAFRRERLACELKESNPDIVCLQEVNSGHHAQFYKPLLNSLGYSGIYKRRTGAMLDGCALFYKTSKFTFLDKIELEFFRRNLTSLLNRDNVAIVCVLKPSIPSSSGSNSFDSNRLVIATTHLIFNPSRGDVKLAQLRLLLAELDQLTKSFNPSERFKTNVILCGDMNLVPHSPIYDFITTGFLDTSGYTCGDLSGQTEGVGRGKLIRPSDLKLEGINQSSQYTTRLNEKQKSRSSDASEDNWRSRNTTNSKYHEKSKSLPNKYTADDFLKDASNDVDERTGQVMHNFKFSSVYPVNDVNNSPFITTHHGMGSCMVDYIFYNRSDSLELLGYTRLLNSEQISRIGSLPNHFQGSDHLSLHAKFLLKDIIVID